MGTLGAVSLAPSPQVGMDSRAQGAVAPGYKCCVRAGMHQGILPPLLFPRPGCCGHPWERRDESGMSLSGMSPSGMSLSW